MKYKIIMVVAEAVFLVISILSCINHKDVSIPVENNKSTLLIGKIEGIGSYEAKLNMIKDDGTKQSIDESQVSSLNFEPGTSLSVGLDVYYEGQLIANSMESSSECPYTDLVTEPGQNVVNIKVCKAALASGGSSSTASSSVISGSMDCSGNSIQKLSFDSCQVFEKSVDSSAKYYSSCFSRLPCIAFSQIKCSNSSESIMFITCRDKNISDGQSCQYEKGLLNCNNFKLFAVKVSKIYSF